MDLKDKNKLELLHLKIAYLDVQIDLRSRIDKIDKQIAMLDIDKKKQEEEKDKKDE